MKDLRKHDVMHPLCSKAQSDSSILIFFSPIHCIVPPSRLTHYTLPPCSTDSFTTNFCFTSTNNGNSSRSGMVGNTHILHVLPSTYDFMLHRKYSEESNFSPPSLPPTFHVRKYLGVLVPCMSFVLFTTSFTTKPCQMFHHHRLHPSLPSPPPPSNSTLNTC